RDRRARGCEGPRAGHAGRAGAPRRARHPADTTAAGRAALARADARGGAGARAPRDGTGAAVAPRRGAGANARRLSASRAHHRDLQRQGRRREVHRRRQPRRGARCQRRARGTHGCRHLRTQHPAHDGRGRAAPRREGCARRGSHRAARGVRREAHEPRLHCRSRSAGHLARAHRHEDHHAVHQGRAVGRAGLLPRGHAAGHGRRAALARAGHARARRDHRHHAAGGGGGRCAARREDVPARERSRPRHRREHELAGVREVRHAHAALWRGRRTQARGLARRAAARRDPTASAGARGRRRRGADRRRGTGFAGGARAHCRGAAHHGGDRQGGDRVTEPAALDSLAHARPPDDTPAAALPLNPRDGLTPIAVTGEFRVPAALVHGALSRTLLKFALPSVASMLLMTLFFTADAFWVGRYVGADGLAAVSTSIFWIWMIVSLADMISVGLTAVASRRHGEGQPRLAARAVGDAVLFAVLLGCVIAVLGHAWRGAMFAVMDTPAGVTALGTVYLGTYLLGTPLLFGFFAVDAGFRASGDTRTPFLLLLSTVLVGLLLDPVLILGLGPAPHLGIAGAAIATIFTRAIAFLIGVVILARRRLIVMGRLTIAALRPIVRVGLPTAVTGVVFANIYVLLTRTTTHFGTPALAALGVGHRVESWTFMIGVGF